MKSNANFALERLERLEPYIPCTTRSRTEERLYGKWRSNVPSVPSVQIPPAMTTTTPTPTEAPVTHPHQDIPVDIDLTNPTPGTRWQTQAACANRPDTAPPANWFPDQHHAHDQAVTEAKRICREECPVRWDCLHYALITDRHRDKGIYGGLSARTRARLRARLIAENRLPVVRICANPACRKPFTAKPTTPRDNVCCSNQCRLIRRRLIARMARNNQRRA